MLVCLLISTGLISLLAGLIISFFLSLICSIIFSLDNSLILFLLKYPYFKSLDPNFNHKLEITTMTITGILESDQYINKEIDNRIPDINYLVILKDHLSNDFINSLITSTDTFTIKPQKRKYHKRCEKKASH